MSLPVIYIFAIGLGNVIVVLLIWFFAKPSRESVQRVQHVVPFEKRMPAINPFVFDLSEPKSNSSYREGVNCCLSSEVKFIIQDFWGVHIQNLFEILRKDWHILKNDMDHGQLLENSCLLKGKLIHEDPCINSLKKFIPPDQVDEVALGIRPRVSYPLVVFMVRESVPDDCRMVGIIVIVHVKDDLMPMETHVIDTYVKMSDNKVHVMKKVFAPPDENNDGRPTCAVCRVSNVEIVFLPCRHMCTCRECFSKLKACPMCRTFIRSYFTVNI